jgi:DNA repair exonuclease SbcCD ATPase subunit
MKPVSLKMENFFSHKDSEIDFEFNSALLIGNSEGDYTKSNGSGKSSIFESILWCIFNKSRAGVMNDVVKWGESDCKVEFQFSIKDVKYKIIRTRNRVNSSSEVEFYKENSLGDWQDMSGSTSSLTNSNIEQEIKTDYKTFINSVYFRQNDISEFAEAEPFKKKEILKNIIDISRWDQYEKNAKAVLKDYKAKIKLYESELEEADDLSELKDSVENDLQELKEDLKYLEDKKSELSNFHKNYFEKYIAIKSNLDTNKYDEIIDSISRDKEALKDILKDMGSEKDTVSSRKKDLEELSSEIKSINSKLASYVKTENVDKKLSSLRDTLVTEKSEIRFLLSKRKDLSSKALTKGSCDHCGQDICEDYIESYRSSCEKILSDIESKLKTKKNDLKSLENQINSLESARSINQKIQSLETELRYKLSGKSSSEDSLSRAEARLSALSSKHDEYKLRVSNNELVLEGLKDDSFKDIKTKLKSISKDLEDVQTKIIEKSKSAGFFEQKLKNTMEKIDILKKKNEELKEIKKISSEYEMLSKFFGKSGVQTILLENIIADLQSTSNVILKNICNEPLSIVFETQRVRSDGVKKIETLDLKIMKDGFCQDFRSLSGGEKFRIALSLRIGLSELSSRYGGSSLEFIMMDEVNSPLDRFGVETLFVSVIKSLEDKYKIMVITHDESLKEKFDNVIDVTKVNGESSINITSFS